LKNVPLRLVDEIKKHRTMKSTADFTMRWKYREPKKGQKVSWGGALRRENAKSADLYIDSRKDFSRSMRNEIYLQGYDKGKASQEIHIGNQQKQHLRIMEASNNTQAIELERMENEYKESIEGYRVQVEEHAQEIQNIKKVSMEQTTIGQRQLQELKLIIKLMANQI